MIKTNPCKLYWSVLVYDEQSCVFAATSKGLCYVGNIGSSLDELEKWAEARLKRWTAVKDDDKLNPFANELMEYFQGKRKVFSFPIDLRGTPFQRSVWKLLMDIPYGKTCAYSDIAGLLNKPKAVRAVGAAIGANPVLIAIPCHRVVGKNGRLTGYRGGLEMKERLLQLERENRGASLSSI